MAEDSEQEDGSYSGGSGEIWKYGVVPWGSGAGYSGPNWIGRSSNRSYNSSQGNSDELRSQSLSVSDREKIHGHKPSPEELAMRANLPSVRFIEIDPTSFLANPQNATPDEIKAAEERIKAVTTSIHSQKTDKGTDKQIYARVTIDTNNIDADITTQTKKYMDLGFDGLAVENSASLTPQQLETSLHSRLKAEQEYAAAHGKDPKTVSLHLEDALQNNVAILSDAKNHDLLDAVKRGVVVVHDGMTGDNPALLDKLVSMGVTVVDHEAPGTANVKDFALKHRGVEVIVAPDPNAPNVPGRYIANAEKNLASEDLVALRSKRPIEDILVGLDASQTDAAKSLDAAERMGIKVDLYDATRSSHLDQIENDVLARKNAGHEIYSYQIDGAGLKPEDTVKAFKDYQTWAQTNKVETRLTPRNFNADQWTALEAAVKDKSIDAKTISPLALAQKSGPTFDKASEAAARLGITQVGSENLAAYKTGDDGVILGPLSEESIQQRLIAAQQQMSKDVDNMGEGAALEKYGVNTNAAWCARMMRGVIRAAGLNDQDGISDLAVDMRNAGPEIAPQDVKVGDFIVHDYHNGHGHTGMVTAVNRDKAGNPTSVEMWQGNYSHSIRYTTVAMDYGEFHRYDPQRGFGHDDNTALALNMAANDNSQDFYFAKADGDWSTVANGEVSSQNGKAKVAVRLMSPEGIKRVLAFEGWDGEVNHINGVRYTRPTPDTLGTGDPLTAGPGVTHFEFPSANPAGYTDEELMKLKSMELAKDAATVAQAEVYAKTRMLEKGAIKPEQAADPNYHVWGQQANDGLTSFTYNLGGGAMDKLMAGSNPGHAGMAGLISGSGAIDENGRYQPEALGDTMTEYVHAKGVVLPGLVTRRGDERKMVIGDPGPDNSAPVAIAPQAPNTTMPAQPGPQASNDSDSSGPRPNRRALADEAAKNEAAKNEAEEAAKKKLAEAAAKKIGQQAGAASHSAPAA